MIYVTGDCHADFTRFNTKIFPEQYEMTKDDYVIICGDFGGVWNRFEENKYEKHWMDWLENRLLQLFFGGKNFFSSIFLLCFLEYIAKICYVNLEIIYTK